MRADQFIYIGWEAEIADLGACVHRSDLSACKGVPELDASVGSSSAGH